MTWIAIVTVWLGWQTLAYSGLAAELTEWEFARFDEAFPAITYIFLLVLFAAPALIVIQRVSRRGTDPRPSPVLRLLTRGRRVLRLLVGLSVGIGVLAVIVVVQFAMLPDSSAQVRRIDLAHTGGMLPEGPAMLTGHFRENRAAVLDQRLLFLDKRFRFVPADPTLSAHSTLRVFIESDADGKQLPLGGERTGILRRGSLPGAIVRLYRNAGIEVAPTHYVLYQDRAAMQWPLLSSLVRLALALIVVGVAALVTRRRMHDIRQLVLSGLAPR